MELLHAASNKPRAGGVDIFRPPDGKERTRGWRCVRHAVFGRRGWALIVDGPTFLSANGRLGAHADVMEGAGGHVRRPPASRSLGG